MEEKILRLITQISYFVDQTHRRRLEKILSHDKFNSLKFPDDRDRKALMWPFQAIAWEVGYSGLDENGYDGLKSLAFDLGEDFACMDFHKLGELVYGGSADLLLPRNYHDGRLVYFPTEHFVKMNVPG